MEELRNMVDKNKLAAEITLNGMTQASLCQQIGMSTPTFIRKVKMNAFRTDEVERIIDKLPTLRQDKSRAFPIFFA